MSQPRTQCNQDHVDQFLQNELPWEEIECMESHLSVCEKCQSYFDSSLNQFAHVEQRVRSLDASHLAEYSSRLDSSNGSQIVGEDPRTVGREEMLALAKQILEPSANPLMLGKLGDFEIVEPIGAGSMGMVFRGYDKELHRYVAIKLLTPSISLVGAARQRFLREAQAAASIVSPFVVPIHAVGTANGLPYLVMSLVPGENMQEAIHRDGPMSMLQTVRLGHQVALGLASAHERGIIHRDVKPGNILLERNKQRALLTDFGLAQVADNASLTHSGLLAGTPSFMSPEQATGSDLDPRSDLFSLGSVLYTMLTGQPPFRGSNAFAIVKRLAEDKPRSLISIDPAVPSWMDQLVMRLLAKIPDARWESAQQVADLLAECEKHLENPSLYPIPSVLRPHISRNIFERKMALGGLIVLSAAILFLALRFSGMFFDSSEPKERDAFVLKTPDKDRLPSLELADSVHTENSQGRLPLSTQWDDERDVRLETQRLDLILFHLESEL